jgi:photosystem II stability/assembly factor-like uncharacterized protein
MNCQSVRVIFVNSLDSQWAGMRSSGYFRRKVPALMALVVTLFAVGCGSSGWDSVNPHYTAATAPKRPIWTPEDSPLNAIRGFGNDSFYAVGDDGLIIHSVDGNHWSHQISRKDLSLKAIFGTPDGKSMWIVGDGGTILHSDGGQSWSPQFSHIPWGLNSIYGSEDGKRLIAAGQAGTIIYTNDGKYWVQAREVQHIPLYVF